MDNNTFNNALLSAFELPFAPEEVTEVDSNCGSVWVTLKNGKVYVIQVTECENEEDENSGQPIG